MLSSMIMGWIFYDNTYLHTTKLLQEEALNIAKSANMLINGSEFEELSKSLNPKDPFYINTRNKLKKLNESIGNGMLYAIVSNNSENYTYIVDGSATVEIGYEQKKCDFAKEVEMAFQTGKAYTSKPYYVETFKKYYISAFVPIVNQSNKVVGVMEYDFEGKELSQKINELKMIIILSMLMIVIVTIIINSIALKIMFRPINKLVEAINTIANGDLTLSIDTSRKDEIGKINIALNKTVVSLRDMVEKIKASCTKVTEASQGILISSSDTSKATEEVAISTNEISSISNEQVIKTQKIKDVLSKLDADIQNIFSQIKDTNKIAYKTLEDANNGTEVVKDTNQKIDQIEESIHNANLVVTDLTKNMSKIQGILTTISSIAEQTNLLSLNAAIEAARAGENGRGFAVVADEVRKLAVESNTAANEIVGIITFMNEETNKVLQAITTSINKTREGKEYTDHVSNTFEIIKTSNVTIENKTVETENSASKIVSSIANINENMNEIEQVSKIIDSNTRNLASSTEEEMASAGELKVMSEVLNEEAKILNECISKFRI
jgi:methyl-accepting chemotaxis protein